MSEGSNCLLVTSQVDILGVQSCALVQKVRSLCGIKIDEISL